MATRSSWRKAALACSAIAIFGSFLAGGVIAQERMGTTHTLFVTLYEVKGTTTTDKLAPPVVDPKDFSKGYAYKGPGEADKSAPAKWEVSSYMFNPAVVAVRQGDDIVMTAFVVNGDEHEVWVAAPDGQIVAGKTKWNRGREYQMRFAAEQAGTYQLICSSHAPSMNLSFMVLPRESSR